MKVMSVAGQATHEVMNVLETTLTKNTSLGHAPEKIAPVNACEVRCTVYTHTVAVACKRNSWKITDVFPFL